jgi:hypothetical protein
MQILTLEPIKCPSGSTAASNSHNHNYDVSTPEVELIGIKEPFALLTSKLPSSTIAANYLVTVTL